MSEDRKSTWLNVTPHRQSNGESLGGGGGGCVLGLANFAAKIHMGAGLGWKGLKG